MPRDSVLSPPVTTCLPRKTSPSIVATGYGTVGAIRDAASKDSAISAPPITAWIAAGNGPPIRTTDSRGTAPVRNIRLSVCLNVCLNARMNVRVSICLNDRRAAVRAADHETASAGIFLANQLQAGRHVLEPLDQHVLQQVAEARLDRALVLRLDLDEVRQRAHLPDLAVGVDEHHARRIGKAAAMRVDFLERVQARGHAGQLLLARAHVARSPFVLEAGAGQFGLARRSRHARRLEAFLGAMQSLGGRHPLRASPLELGAEFARFEIAAARSPRPRAPAAPRPNRAPPSAR